MEHAICPEAQVKIESVRNDLRRCEETGNPQYIYYAQRKLQEVTELQRHKWQPEADAK